MLYMLYDMLFRMLGWAQGHQSARPVDVDAAARPSTGGGPLGQTGTSLGLV